MVSQTVDQPFANDMTSLCVATQSLCFKKGAVARNTRFWEPPAARLRCHVETRGVHEWPANILRQGRTWGRERGVVWFSLRSQEPPRFKSINDYTSIKIKLIPWKMG